MSEDSAVEEKQTDKASATNVGILGSLACAYASSDDEDDSNKPEPEKPSKMKRRKKHKTADSQQKQRLLTDGQIKYQLTKKRQRRQPTLLEMLLAPEIRRERNIILQCVRYIVKKNFFED